MPLLPAILIIIDGPNEDHRYCCPQDLYYENKLYKGLAEFPDVSAAYTELMYGFLDRSTVTITLDNSEGQITDTFFSDDSAGPVDLRGCTITITRVDYTPEQDTTPSAWASEETFELLGRIDSLSCGKTKAKLEVSFREPVALQALLCSKKVTVEDFPDAPEESLGQPIPLLIGKCYKSPLIRIKSDFDGNEEHYLVGYGTTYSNDSNKDTTVDIYRGQDRNSSDAIISDLEEGLVVTCYDGSGGSPYPGYATVKFSGNGWQQADLSGRYYTTKCNWWGLEISDTDVEENVVYAIQEILSNSTWGRNQSVNVASFATAAAVAAVDALVVSIRIFREIKTKAVIDELLSYCRGRLDQNTSGEWIITVDGSYDASSFTNLYSGRSQLGKGQTNIKEFGEQYYTPAPSAVKTIIYEYAPDDAGEFAFSTSSRTVNSDFGEERKEQLNYVRDKETADRIACYQQRLKLYGARRIDLTLGQVGRSLSVGDVVKLYIPEQNLSGDLYRIETITKSKTTSDVTVVEYSSDIYTYSDGTLPDDSGVDDPTDFSRIAPDAPTDLSIASSGTEVADDGSTQAYVILSAIPGTDTPANFAYMMFGWRRDGETTYSFIVGEYTEDSNNAWNARIGGLIPGADYDYTAFAYNVYNLKTETASPLDAQTAPTDSTKPDDVSALVATAKIEGIQLGWTKVTNRDLKEYAIFRKVGAGGSYSEYKRVKANQWVDPGVSYGTTYYYKIKAVDFSENYSSNYSNEDSATPQKVVDGIGVGEIGDSHISCTTLSAASAYTGNLTVSGALTLNSSGHIKGGQSGYNSGAGFFLGYSGGAYKFSIGNPAGNFMTWNGSALTINGAVDSLTLAAGADITLTSAASNQAKLIFSSIMEIYGYSTGNTLRFEPTAVGKSLYFGTAYALNAGIFYVSASGGYFSVETLAGYLFKVTQGGAIQCNLNVVPNATGTRDLGAVGTKWSSVWCNNILYSAAVGIQWADGTYTNTYMRPTSGQHIIFGGATNDTPADAELINNGDWAIYFNEASNSAYIMYKKADGSVVSGSIAFGMS